MENERTWFGEPVNGSLSQYPSDLSINSLIEVSLHSEVVLQDVQTTHHLGEDEDLVSILLQFGKKLVNEHKFP